MWTPDLRGVIRTEDGAGDLISLRGQSVQEDSSDVARRAILTRVELLSEHERYRWLNTSFVVGEGGDRRGDGRVVGGDLRLRERGGPVPALHSDEATPRFRQADR